MFSLSMHGVTKVFSVDINSSSDVLGTGWVTLQVATRNDTYNKNSKETHQAITFHFEDLEEGISSFMEEMITAYDAWQQDNTVLRRKDTLEPSDGVY